MLFTRDAIRLISIVLIIFLLNSCVHYSRTEVSKQEPIPYAERVLHILEHGQQKSDCYITSVTLKDDSLSGEVRHLPEKPPVKKSRIVNLYLKEGYNLPSELPATVTIPMDYISKIEVYDVNLGLTIFTTVLMVAGVLVVLYAIVLLIVILTKESCPFIYSFNGKDYVFEGEIFSGAILPALERHDYLPLPSLKPVAGEYRLKMTNEVKEIQYPNLTELIVVDHPQGSTALLDKNGKCHTLLQPQAPLSARSSINRDILPLLAARDSMKFSGELEAETSQSKDAVYLAFARPANAKTGKLVLRAKNSFWLDYIMGQFFDLFGDKYAAWYRRQKGRDTGAKGTWSLEQGIPLSVYLKENGEWKFLDYFHVIGAVAEKDVVMECDLSRIEGEVVELKLECGYLFWEIDYAAMDFSAPQQAGSRVVKLAAAVDHNGRDVAGKLNRDDRKYFKMPKIGDQALLTFPAPPQSPGTDRSVFLHSKGYYEVLRDPGGKASLAYLEAFRGAGRLGWLSREKFEQLKDCVNR